MGATGSIRVRSRSQSQETASGKVDSTVRSSRGGIFTVDTGILNPKMNRGVPREITDGNGNGIIINRNKVSQEDYDKAMTKWGGMVNTIRVNSNATYRKAYGAAIKTGFTERQAQTIAETARNQRESNYLAKFLNKEIGEGAARVKTRKGTSKTGKSKK